MSQFVETVPGTDKTIRSGIRFSINYRLADNTPAFDFENMLVYGDSLTSNDLKELFAHSRPAFTSILTSAAKGHPEIARFESDFAGIARSFELHCFPVDEDAGARIDCFLVDRSDEEAERARIQHRIYELGLISQAVRAFAETRNLSEILRIILLAVTAGKGLGFNRGFILLSDDSRECLWGCMGTGPSSPEEAAQIWDDLSRRPLTFNEILRLYKAGGANDAPINELILSIKVPLSGEVDFIARAALERQSVIITPSMITNERDGALRDKFGTDYMAVVPLVTQNSLQGVIVADNYITRRPILQSDLSLLEIFARYASDAIENSRLYGKLEHQLELLREANENIIRSRENLVRAEKLSGIGRMALEVAHQVRNPLTVIGGYANLQLRKIEKDDPSRPILELISNQVNRIEKTLDRFSSVVKLSVKNEDFFPVVELVEETLNMFASDPNPNCLKCSFDDNLRESKFLTDKGLFHQSMMAILREAGRVAGGICRVSLDVVKEGDSAMIFIDSGETNSKFAENFYRGVRERKEEDRYQDMAVALEILRHYGGDIGIGSYQGSLGRLYIQFPLREEGK